jgi:hypothetical protein
VCVRVSTTVCRTGLPAVHARGHVSPPVRLSGIGECAGGSCRCRSQRVVTSPVLQSHILGSCCTVIDSRLSLVLLRHPIRGVSSPPTSLSPTTVVTGATLCSLNSLRAVVARGQLRNFSVCSCWPSILLTHSTTVQQPIPVIHTACVHNGALGDFHAPCTEQRKGVISAQVRLCGWPSADQQGVWREHRLAHRALVHGGVVCETRTHSSARSERARCWRHCHLMPISAAAALNRTFSFTRV